MISPSCTARTWLRRYLDVPLPGAFDIGLVLGQQDRRAGRPDPGLLEEFGFTPGEYARALEGWRRGFTGEPDPA